MITKQNSGNPISLNNKILISKGDLMLLIDDGKDIKLIIVLKWIKI